jgi:single-strand DNA-binding protein
MLMTGLARLGRDAELRYASSGDAVCTLSLAFNYGQKGADGKRPSQWVDAALWGKRAEALQPYLLQGGLVCVTLSDPHIETFERRNGSPGHKLAARVLDIELAGGREEREAAAATAPKPTTPKPAAGGNSFDDMTDDIPF